MATPDISKPTIERGAQAQMTGPRSRRRWIRWVVAGLVLLGAASVVSRQLGGAAGEETGAVARAYPSQD